MSDKTSRRGCECCWRQCEASLLDWVMNWQKPPASSAKQQRVINNTTLASASQPGAHPSFTLFSLSLPLSLLFIITFSQSCFFFLLEKRKRVSNYRRAIHYKWHPPHCTAEIFWVLKKMGFAFTLCSTVFMTRGDRGDEGFFLSFDKTLCRGMNI